MKKITIVGCGNLGSILALSVILKNIEKQKFDKIFLVDPDFITQSSGVFVNENYQNNNYPKVIVLSEILQVLDTTKTKIVAYRKTLDNFLETTSEEDMKNNILIDCRDTVEQKDLFCLKLSCDGKFGKAVFNPKNKDGGSTNYSFYPSKLYSLMLCMEVIHDIFKIEHAYINSKHPEEIYTFNLDKTCLDTHIQYKHLIHDGSKL